MLDNYAVTIVQHHLCTWLLNTPIVRAWPLLLHATPSRMVCPAAMTDSALVIAAGADIVCTADSRDAAAI